MNYALLVGINDYLHKRIPSLFGCEHDVDLMQEYLESEYSPDFHIKCLKTKQATRAAILEQFEQHLGKADERSKVLFYYSGHGALQKSPDEFLTLQRDHRHENLVCHDSSPEGAPLLADKELNLLIKQLADKGAEVVVILDCCHSGSGTRLDWVKDEYVGIRSVKEEKKVRQLESFLDGTEEHILAQPKHILISACGPREFAQETKLNLSDGTSQKRGLLTHCLIDTLMKEEYREKPLSYAKLIHVLRRKVFNLKSYHPQTPRLEVSGGANPYKAFLGDSLGHDQSSPHFLAYNSKRKKWTLNMGQIHGLQAAHSPQIAILDPKDKSRLLGMGTLVKVGIAESRMAEEKFLDPKNTYPVLEPYVERLPLSVHFVQGYPNLDLLPATLERKEGQFALVSKEEFKAAIPQNFPARESTYTVSQKDGGYQLTYSDTGKPLVDRQIPTLSLLAKLLVHISKWERVHRLQHPNLPPHPGLPMLAIKTHIDHLRLDNPPNHLTIDVESKGEKVNIEYKAANLSGPDYHIYTHYLSTEFQVNGSSFYAELPQKEKDKLLFHGSMRISPSSPEEVYQATEMFKLIFSTEELPFLNLDLVEKLSDISEKDKPYRESEGSVLKFEEEWFTLPYHFVLLLTLAHLDKQPTRLLNGRITIGGHDHFRARLSLRSTAHAFYPSLQDEEIKKHMTVLGFELLDFSTTNHKHTILELHHIEGADRLLSDPLQIDIQHPDLSTHHMLALVPSDEHSVYEGKLTFPVLGWLEKQSEDEQRLQLTHIYPNKHDGRPVPGHSMKISFIKVRKREDILPFLIHLPDGRQAIQVEV